MHDFAIISPDGGVLVTTNLRHWVIDRAPSWGGVACRWVMGGWVPID